jgi:hypothetical protein
VPPSGRLACLPAAATQSGRAEFFLSATQGASRPPLSPASPCWSSSVISTAESTRAPSEYGWPAGRTTSWPCAEATHAARQLDLDVALQAVDRALVVDVMLRQVASRRQHEMQELEAIGLQQARADRVMQGRPERADVDDVEKLGVGQGHGALRIAEGQARCPMPRASACRLPGGADTTCMRGTR